MSDTGHLRVYIVGENEHMPAVSDALAEDAELALVGVSARGSDAAEPLAQWDVDVVLYAASDANAASRDLDVIREHTTAPIILLAPASSPALLEHALAADVADALVLPQPAQGLSFAIRKVADQRNPAPSDGHCPVITVFSPKGGTGKTMTATNLALALACNEGKRTLLVDLDLQFGDCAIALGLDVAQTIYDLVSAPGEFDADKLRGYTTTDDATGLDLVAAPSRPEEAELVPPTKVANLLDVARSTYDVVVVDTAPFLHGPILSALDHTDRLLVVATLDVPTLKNVRQSLATLELISFPPEHVEMVLNRATAQAGIKRGDVEAALDLRIEYVLPDDPAAQLAVNRGTPVIRAEPHSPFSEAIAAVASSLAGSVAVRSAARAVVAR